MKKFLKRILRQALGALLEALADKVVDPKRPEPEDQKRVR